MSSALQRDIELVATGIEMVASGRSRRVEIVGLRCGEAALEANRTAALLAGVRLLALTGDESVSGVDASALPAQIERDQRDHRPWSERLFARLRPVRSAR